ncbi:MAG: WYL domain-containing protein, partial [bacterium]
EHHLDQHKDNPRPQNTYINYRMQNGALSMKLRAATAGYILRKWSVDCSPDHSLRGHEFRLWLKDPLALYGVKNALLAPGYRSPDKNKGEP